MRPGQPTEDSNDAPKPAHQIEQIVRSQKSRTLKKEDYHQEVMVEAPSSSSQALSAYLEVTEKNPQREKVLRAEQIMSSNVVTLSSSDRLKEARHIFENRRFRHVPIVSNTGKLVGILSDRDLLKNLNQQGIEKPLSIEDVMVKSVLTARPETEIRMIAKIMFDERIGALPIVDSDEKLVGILTRSDILRTIVNRAPLELWT
jgi:acetoin utilization protein AcuB